MGGVILVCSLLLLQCSETPAFSDWTPEDFPNVLDLRGTPDDVRDLTAFAFSDLGAWHMFGLPDTGGGSTPGSFPGPLLLTDGGVWLSSSFVGPALRVGGMPVPVEWDPAAVSPASVLPGLLRMDLLGGGLKVRMELAFASPHATHVKAELRNPGTTAVKVEWGWTGGPFFLPVTLTRMLEGVTMALEGSGTRIILEARDVEGLVIPMDGPQRYTLREAPLTLAPGESVTRYLLISVLPPDQDPGSDLATEAGGAEEQGWEENPEEVFTRAGERWTGYLGAVLGKGKGANTSPTTPERVAVKAMETLISNWRSPRGHLFHGGLFPSYAYRGFHGIWSWDSWKHARALALFAPELAQDQMRVMLDYQDEAGMIPDVIYADSTENNWRDTKPPLAAWAVVGIFRAAADTAFVQETLSALMKYHAWWYRNRDHDGNGLCEYGSTDGTRIAAAWESGMDNAVRFDDAVMVQNGPRAWSLDQESVDLNAYLYAEKGYLAELAQVVGRGEDARILLEEQTALGALIRETFFDEGTGFFHDVHLDTKEPIRVEGPEGWIPLWAGIATETQAQRVARVMSDSAKFNGTVPLPTLTMDHPAFDPSNGYWRGPVWLDQFYFGVEGLRRCGFEDDAREMVRRLLTSAQGLAGDGPIFENYHPVTGEGLNAAHFSWSAAHLLMLYQEGFMAWDDGSS